MHPSTQTGSSFGSQVSTEMLVMKLLQYVLSFMVTQVVALPETRTLYAQSIQTPSRFLELGQFEIEPEMHTITCINELASATYDSQVKDGELYCIHWDDNECFTLVELTLPLSYTLLWNYEINKFSLIYNHESNGTKMVVRNSTRSELADVIKLKKITKTYADKKKEMKNVVLDKEADEVGEGAEKSWLEQNWKKIVVGLVLYNLVALGFKKPAQDEESKK